MLVVDDNVDSAESLTMLLQVSGHETHTAHDGLEAVAAAERYRPEVVLLDIGLPSLNGYDAARRIREQPWGKDMVLIALTGWGQEADRRKSKDAGFDQHMVKPVDLDALMRLLASLPGGSRPMNRRCQAVAGDALGLDISRRIPTARAPKQQPADHRQVDPDGELREEAPSRRENRPLRFHMAVIVRPRLRVVASPILRRWPEHDQEEPGSVPRSRRRAGRATAPAQAGRAAKDGQPRRLRVKIPSWATGLLDDREGPEPQGGVEHEGQGRPAQGPCRCSPAPRRRRRASGRSTSRRSG
jgi:CheY-like chemotaxis protein